MCFKFVSLIFIFYRQFYCFYGFFFSEFSESENRKIREIRFTLVQSSHKTKETRIIKKFGKCMCMRVQAIHRSSRKLYIVVLSTSCVIFSFPSFHIHTLTHTSCISGYKSCVYSFVYVKRESKKNFTFLYFLYVYII